jgi:DNA-binding MarR family transcriptional regulator
MLVVASVLLFCTISTIFFYYRRIRTLNEEYGRTKGTINDIVVSIDRQFSRQKDRVLFFTQKIENILLENKNFSNKVEDYERQVINLNESVADVPQFEDKVTRQLHDMRREFVDIKEVQEKVMRKLVEIEKIKREAYGPEMKIEAAIPIKREKVLEPLTETELMVIEIIGKEGEKTAPEIREKINLTREHTARLMKKLYKNGYLERDTHKMPYVYRLKEEMQKILKKRETSAF